MTSEKKYRVDKTGGVGNVPTSLVKINNEKVKPVKVKEEKKKPVKGANLFPEPYANIFLVARKKSGKTSVINKILKDCATTHTTVIAFVSTLDKDANWKAIRAYLEKKRIPFVGYTGIKNDEGVDLLQVWIDNQQQEQKQDEEEYEEDAEAQSAADAALNEAEQMANASASLMFDEGVMNADTIAEEGEEKAPAVRKKRPSKYEVPEYIFVFDDLSDQLKSKSLTALLKKNRHFKCKIIVSSQYLHDLEPQALKQMDYWLIFAGQPLEKLQKIYKDADVAVDFGTFVKVYQNATAKEYCFMYVDVQKDKFRKCFTDEYVLESKK